MGFPTGNKEKHLSPRCVQVASEFCFLDFIVISFGYIKKWTRNSQHPSTNTVEHQVALV